jgi:Fasciclin domain
MEMLFNFILHMLKIFIQSPRKHEPYKDRFDVLSMHTVFISENYFVQAMASKLNDSELEHLLAYHFVPNASTASELHDDRILETMDHGKQLLIKDYHSV